MPDGNWFLTSLTFLGDFSLILRLAPDLPSVASPETLMDTKWVTSELAWTSHPESGVRLAHYLH